MTVLAALGTAATLAACSASQGGDPSELSRIAASVPAANPGSGVSGDYVADQAGAVSDAAADLPPATPAPDSVGVTGRLATELVAKEVPRMGSVVTDQEGWILYRFDKDSAEPPTSLCSGACAKTWPPVLVDSPPELKGVSDTVFGSIQRDDGTRQVTIGGWPVYHYSGDKKPGSWKGQGFDGTWFVVTKDGERNLTCLPQGFAVARRTADKTAKGASPRTARRTG